MLFFSLLFAPIIRLNRHCVAAISKYSGDSFGQDSEAKALCLTNALERKLKNKIEMRKTQ